MALPSLLCVQTALGSVPFNEECSWHLKDHRGGVLAAVDDEGKGRRGAIGGFLGGLEGVEKSEKADVLGVTSYLPYGELRQSPGKRAVEGFTGQRRDDETGLDNFNARVYDSSFCRFLQPDPEPHGNGYAYCSGDPVNRIDPSGAVDVWNDGMSDVKRYGRVGTPISLWNWIEMANEAAKENGRRWDSYCVNDLGIERTSILGKALGLDDKFNWWMEQGLMVGMMCGAPGPGMAPQTDIGKKLLQNAAQYNLATCVARISEADGYCGLTEDKIIYRAVQKLKRIYQQSTGHKISVLATGLEDADVTRLMEKGNYLSRSKLAEYGFPQGIFAYDEKTLKLCAQEKLGIGNCDLELSIGGYAGDEGMIAVWNATEFAPEMDVGWFWRYKGNGKPVDALIGILILE